MSKVKEYIEQNIKNTIREVKEDVGTYIRLPFPFTVPSLKGAFQEMYYWDTYFINVGLISDGYLEQAKNNCLNFQYLVDRFGYIPNGSRTYFLSRSQPPYFAFAAKELEDFYSYEELKSLYDSIKREYFWWQTNRRADNGLNFYGDNGVSDDVYIQCGTDACLRMGKVFNNDLRDIGKNFLAIAESGWDCSPRFDTYKGKLGCIESSPLDLNCNLFFYETYLGNLQKKLIIDDGENWEEKASERKSLIEEYMWNSEKQIYLDYNFVTKKQCDVISCAAFHPYFTKMASEDKRHGLMNAYRSLVKEYGVAATDKNYGNYQWSYPNGWANLHYIAYIALKNYGFNHEAKNVAEKYLTLIDKSFAETGSLWEKYNVINGSVKVVNEYEMPEMMGWTAGVYLYFYKALNLD